MNKRFSWMALSIVVSVGILAGLSLYTFDYAEGTSYFLDDPSACIYCHVMQAQFDNWNRSTHQAVATCNDCHTPHAFPDKWIVKGVNGWNHSVAFTSGDFPNTIQIREFNLEVALDNCVDCHQTMVSAINHPVADQALSCVACHGNVGH